MKNILLKLGVIALFSLAVTSCSRSYYDPNLSEGTCTVTSVSSPVAGSLISCPDGSSSLVVSGTAITPVQFCPGTPSYPTVFPEIGFCIDNQLYAVYSTNGGFLALLTPGTYSSNGIDDSCTFNVGPNCSVSY